MNSEYPVLAAYGPELLISEALLMLSVLIVEDHVMNRKLLHDLLAIHFEVFEVETAEDALVFLETRTPDLLMLDLSLPGMDGLTLAGRLKDHPAHRTIPIVAISAHVMQTHIDQAMQVGCVEYVTKPIIEDPLEFADRMRALVTGTER